MGSMFEDQPQVIQDPDLPKDASPWARKPTPLVLIHDGGGTIFSYYCLDHLGRPVYGIANPHYESGNSWAGGIPEMARQYLKFIKSAVPSGDVIIGGWSLGGLISLEVARQLADEKDGTLNLLGIVMIDSVCPVVRTAPLLPVVQHAMKWGEHTRQDTKDRVMRCFSEAIRMVGEWPMPAWEEGHQEKEHHGSRPKGSLANRPPPVILLRAMEPVPSPEGGIARVDIHRGDQLLGWGNYNKDLITKVMDIPGHHFNIFHTDDTLETTAEGIKRACVELEGMDRNRAFA
ncbi:Alpha/Beta hydrolase protein [Chaetomidium leptoderma]|uniref:Alpha/Beta hydrolase protein n=1 Tax=Chaetomidium leptoderma TaxID=669021 RepID=A0AAN6VUI1_9PEZI|nr:Alpha/Beta hydrolase protein [Chaetomidium leptoderma]